MKMHAVGALAVSTVSIGLFAGAVWALLALPLHPEAHDLLVVLIGALAAKFSTVVDYWVGSSAGSAAKMEMLDPQRVPPPAGPQ